MPTPSTRKYSFYFGKLSTYYLFLILIVLSLIGQSIYLSSISLLSATAEHHGEDDAKKKAAAETRPRIAIISSHIPSSQQSSGSSSGVALLDHMLNKACYAHRWGYDFVFNMTTGFTVEETKKAPWLEFGSWHRVPHVASRIGEYDWILYADEDYVFLNTSRPLEAFLEEFDRHGKRDASLFVPKDTPSSFFAFSSFAVMVRNSPFGRKLLENWLDFGRRGACPNGNTKREYDKQTGKLRYGWEHSDQPGLWYAMVQTHREFFYPKEARFYYGGKRNNPYCSAATGLLASAKAFGPELSRYFWQKMAVQGSDGKHLARVPGDQPIIWSKKGNGVPYNGLGYQMAYGIDEEGGANHYKTAFAIHKKHAMPPEFYRELDLCKTRYGCYARYTNDGRFRIGCNGTEFAVPVGPWK